LIWFSVTFGALLVVWAAHWYFGEDRAQLIPFEVFVVISVLLWAVFILARVLLG
jgi:hypothetical protein